MAKQTRNILKSWFETGDKPTQAQFASLIDSFFHLDEDQLTITKVANLETALNNRITNNTAVALMLEVVKRTAEYLNSNFKDKYVGICNSATQFEQHPEAYYYYIASESYEESYNDLGSIPRFSIVYYGEDELYHLFEIDILSFMQEMASNNAFTDTEKEKLANIEVGATADEFTDIQRSLLLELIFRVATGTLSVSPTSFERGVATQLTFSWSVAPNDDTINAATLGGVDISDNLSGSETVEGAVESTTKQLAVVCDNTNHNITINKTSTARTPQWKGYTAATLDNTYEAANTNLTKFLSGSVAATVVVEELVGGGKVVFLSTDSDATIYDANNFDITSAFTKTTITQELADGTTVTLYKYATTEAATLGTYKLQ